jgi:hypothetical protein
VGRRSRQRAGGRAEKLDAPLCEYHSPDGDATLTLRGVLTPRTRAQYADVLHGDARSREDAWQRAVELLFERLVVGWEVSGVPTKGQKYLLLRLRAATQDERRWIRAVLREHVAEHFPDVEAP